MIEISRAEEIYTKMGLAIDALKGSGIKPPQVRTVGRTAYDYRGGKHRIILAPKYLVGELSKLCNVMRENNIPYPWREDDTDTV